MRHPSRTGRHVAVEGRRHVPGGVSALNRCRRQRGKARGSSQRSPPVYARTREQRWRPPSPPKQRQMARRSKRQPCPVLARRIQTRTACSVPPVRRSAYHPRSSALVAVEFREEYAHMFYEPDRRRGRYLAFNRLHTPAAPPVKERYAQSQRRHRSSALFQRGTAESALQSMFICAHEGRE